MILDTQQVETLFRLVKQSIEASLQGTELQQSILELKNDAPYSDPAATFVTLHKNGQLRGCIGSLLAHRSLYEDIASNAISAAFMDPRFPALEIQEFETAVAFEAEISILSEPENIGICDTKEELLEKLRPQVDGLILSDGLRKATFLPSVWEQLPDKSDFVDHLLRKAGIFSWSSNLHCQRYEVKAYSKQWREI